MIKRNKWSITGAIIVFCIAAYLKISPNRISNYIDFISGILSFASLATAIFMAVLIFVPKLSVGYLKNLKTDKKFLNRILLTVASYFAVSVLSLSDLFLFSEHSNNVLSIIFISITLSIFCFSIFESIYVFYIIFYINKL